MGRGLRIWRRRRWVVVGLGAGVWDVDFDVAVAVEAGLAGWYVVGMVVSVVAAGSAVAVSEIELKAGLVAFAEPSVLAVAGPVVEPAADVFVSAFAGARTAVQIAVAEVAEVESGAVGLATSAPVPVG